MENNYISKENYDKWVCDACYNSCVTFIKKERTRLIRPNSCVCGIYYKPFTNWKKEK